MVKKVIAAKVRKAELKKQKEEKEVAQPVLELVADPEPEPQAEQQGEPEPEPVAED